MSLTKIIKRIKQNLDVIVLDMENLNRQNTIDFINRRKTWIKGIRNCIELLNSILNFRKK